MKDERQKVGKRGEDEACRFLEGLGHTIVARNWRTAHLELDIVTIEGGALHIVEVKSRTAPVLVEPQRNVNYEKRKRMVRAAAYFMRNVKGLPAGLETVFDVVSVVFDSDNVKLEYYPQAFIPIYV